MPDFVYISFDYHKNTDTPVWVNSAVAFLQEHHIPFYVVNSGTVPEDYYTKEVPEVYSSIISKLDLDPDLLLSVKSVKDSSDEETMYLLTKQLRAFNVKSSIDSLFFDLYALIRSDIVLCNVSPTCNVNDVLISRFFGKKVVGITNHFVIDPYFLYYQDDVFSFNKKSSIIRLLETAINGQKK
jgi:hypothetical protein